MTIWIGEIQWMLRNGYGYARDPILKPLTNIETCDALIDWSDPENPTEADWPDADVIIGNPPFLGGEAPALRAGRRLRRVALPPLRWSSAARGRLRDLLAREGAGDGRSRAEPKRVGLLATQGIRGGANRRVIERIKSSGDLFLAWSDEPWVLDGANVHISFLGLRRRLRCGADARRTSCGLHQREPHSRDRPDPGAAAR